MADSIFTKIIRGDIPCHKVYEDDKVLAFLDIFPTVPGHLLIVSKKQVEFLWDLPDEDYQALTAATKKVAKRLRNVLNVKYVGVKVVGTDVPHAHVHLVPFNDAKDYYKRHSTTQADDTELAKMAAKLAF